MPTSTEALVEAIERSLFVYPVLPGLNDGIDVHGIEGRETPVSHPSANLVGCATLPDDGADAAIGKVHDRFARSGKAFGWVTSEASRPGDIAWRLTAVDLVKADELAGMVLGDLAAPIAANPDVAVRRATAGEQRQAVPMMASAYGLPIDVAEWFAELLIACEGRLDVTTYHAFVPETDAPVAFGNVVFIPGTRIVLLGGAATLPDFRGRGIYSALVAKRLADAHAAGADAAVIQAVRGTSAPLCAKLGFRELLPMEFYAWVPAGMEIDLHA